MSGYCLGQYLIYSIDECQSVWCWDRWLWRHGYKDRHFKKLFFLREVSSAGICVSEVGEMSGSHENAALSAESYQEMVIDSTEIVPRKYLAAVLHFFPFQRVCNDVFVAFLVTERK